METTRLDERPSLILTRSYPVAPEKVWRAWTDPQALKQWFRPNASFSIPVVETDVRVGGTRLELRHESYVDMENQPTHEQGWNGALDQLGHLLQEK